ncbi:hypothetical protein PRIPAC_81726 [Pristionchus pacificus]|uniref:Membrane transporter n=1 Tax=Pristionchus pacificus TaxID=54126 RepID=A0A2A6CJF8_PRIPA|nr:hypothetical protein PRIPAC_81726 [Pristionchus pacificus]|eukprot:PDM78355.1 membrane transporter [Pristionchus pacificus]
MIIQFQLKHLSQFRGVTNVNPDWYYIRSPVGVNTFRNIHGSKLRRGVQPNGYAKASESVIRKALKRGRKDLDRIAAELRRSMKPLMKRMRDSLYGWLCALMLGIGQMCLYTGFDSSSFVVEPILHSVANREPGRIDTHAGYFGSAVCLLVYTFANLFAPWVLGMVGSKLTLVLASSCVTLYFLSFMYIHFIPYYLAAVLLGVGFALFYAGNGGYLTEHSSRSTIERNTTLSARSASNETTSQNDFREFSDSDIRLMYGSFAGVAFIANFIFAVLPRRAVANSLAEVNERKHRIGLGEQLVKMGRALADHRMVQMAPAFCLVGTTTTFWISVYPTTMTFTKKLSEHIYLPAYYSLVLGSADIIMGCTIMVLSKRIRNFAQMPTLVIVILFGRVAAKTHKNERTITEATNVDDEKISEKKRINDEDE